MATDVLTLPRKRRLPLWGIGLGVLAAFATLVSNTFTTEVTASAESNWEDQNTLTGCDFDGYYPGARGFGACNRGGATTTSNVYYVTNLNAAGAGSFDAALTSACANSGVIVFDVSGVIEYGDDYVIPNPCSDVTIAGETAPAPGIFLKEFIFRMRGATNFVVSHIYVAPGDEGAWYDSDNRDVMDFAGPFVGDNVWVQNLTGMWASDETFTCYPADTNTTIKSNVSFHQTAIVEPLHKSIHSDTYHSKGSLTREECEYFDNTRFVILHSADRNPRTYSPNRFIANAVVYNWGSTITSDIFPPTGALGTAATFERIPAVDNWTNFIDNIYVKGPETLDGTRSDAIGLVKASVTGNTIYEANNVLWTQGGHDRDCDTPAHNCFDGSNAGVWAAAQIASAYPTGYVPESMPATNPGQIVLAQKILNHAGARPTERPTYHSRINTLFDGPINRMNGSGDEGQIKDCVAASTCANDAGGWPTLAENTIDHSQTNHCNGPLPTATKDNVTLSERTVLHEWLITCQDAMMPSGWRQLTLDID